MRPQVQKQTRREFLRTLKTLGIGVLALGWQPLLPRVPAGPVQEGNTPKVAVYAGPGTWHEGRQATHQFLRFLGWKSQEIGPWDVNHWNPDPNEAKYQVIWVPGGWAYDYKRWISAEGKRRLREFVSRGGLYIGICAGAYFASDFIVWEGVRYEYDLDLFHGSSEGPIPDIAPWPQWTLTPVWAEGASEPLLMLYYGGQVFRPSSKRIEAQQEVHIVARWGSGAGTQEGEPAGIVVHYGEGCVLLLGPHPEIGYNFDRKSWDIRGENGAQWAWLASQIETLCKAECA